MTKSVDALAPLPVLDGRGFTRDRRLGDAVFTGLGLDVPTPAEAAVLRVVGAIIENAEGQNG